MRAFAALSDFLAVRAGVLTIAVALIAGGSYYYQVSEREDSERCQAEYNKVFTEQLRERSRLNTSSDDAKTELLAGLGKLVQAKPTVDEKKRAKRNQKFVQLFRDYDAITMKIAADREATKLPEFPSC